MYQSRIRFLFVLLCLVLFCSAAQATNLLITVQDSVDNSTIPHATVFLNGVNVGLTNSAGQFLLQSGQEISTSSLPWTAMITGEALSAETPPRFLSS